MVLGSRELNRAVLARQGLLERALVPLPRMLERTGGLQAQYAPAMYVGLWSRVEGFERAALDRALARRSVIQATLMRATIHLVSRDDYWPLARAVGGSRRRQYLRAYPSPDAAQLDDAAGRLRTALAAGPLWRREVEALVGKDAARGVGHFLDLVRVPPGGTWDRRRADRWALAADWVGPPSAPDGGERLVRRYLRGFGPASRHDVAAFAGLPVTELDPVLERVGTRRFEAEDGTPLFDLPRAPLPAADTPAPVRLIGHWDAILLAHARRAAILPEAHRPRIFHTRRPFSTAVFLVDGAVAGEWSLGADGRFTHEAYERLDAATRRELEAEGDRFSVFARV